MFVRTLMTAAALAAQSQFATASEPSVIGPKEVRELVVQPQPKCLPAESAPAPAPKIVGTFPAQGQVVRPGLLVFQITFDRPMTCGGLLTPLANVADPCPSDAQTLAWSADRKTFRTLCATQPGQSYGVVLGGGCALPFVSLDDRRAEPLAVRFTTSDGPAVTTVSDALAADAGAHSSTPSADSPVNPGLAGAWRGQANGSDYWGPLLLRVGADATGALAAALDAPLQSAFDLPLEGFRRDGQQVEFTLSAMGGWSYVGTLSADGSTIRGFWTQRGQRTPTDFKCMLGRTVQRPNRPLREVLTLRAPGPPVSAP
jgi:hypothetical protein